jgi:hypothetical protein
MGSPRTTTLARRKRKRRRRRAKARGAIAPVRAVWRAFGAPAPRMLGRGGGSRLDAVKRSPWKVLGVAGMAGVAATGVVVVRNRRARSELEPGELRERLHERLAAAGGQAEQAVAQAVDPHPARVADPRQAQAIDPQLARAVGPQESRAAASPPDPPA